MMGIGRTMASSSRGALGLTIISVLAVACGGGASRQPSASRVNRHPNPSFIDHAGTVSYSVDLDGPAVSAGLEIGE